MAPPVTSTVVQVIEYCLNCRTVNGPTRYNSDEALYVKIKVLPTVTQSQTSHLWYQIRIGLQTSVRLSGDILQFLNAPGSQLRVLVAHSQSLHPTSHLNIICPVNGSCKVHVNTTSDTVSLESLEREQSTPLNGIDFKFRIYLNSDTAVPDFKYIVTYLRKLQTLHAMIQVKHAITIPGYRSEFGLSQRLPSRDKLSLFRVTTNPAQYTSLGLDVDRLQFKASCPHLLMPLRLVNTNTDVHFRLTILATLLPPSGTRLVLPSHVGRIKLIMFGPGGVPLLLSDRAKFLQGELKEMMNLEEFGLEATITDHFEDFVLDFDCEYVISDANTNTSDIETSSPRPYTITMFFVFDRWNPSTKCDLMAFSDIQETLRLNMHHMLQTCRSKVRATIQTILAKFVANADPQKDKLKKYRTAINVVVDALGDVVRRSPHEDFRTECLSLMETDNCPGMQREMKKRLWVMAGRKLSIDDVTGYVNEPE